jgi:membrane-associated protease RseP (regulator of RpoE activity)
MSCPVGNLRHREGTAQTTLETQRHIFARGPWVNLLLLVISAGTLALAGGVFWNPPRQDWGVLDLFYPAFLSDVMVAGLPYALWVIAILGAHEMGHYLACRYYGMNATLPYFIPGPPIIGSFGAVIRIRGPIPHSRALFDVAAAGPLAGFLVAIPALVFGLLGAEIVTVPENVAEAYWVLGEPLLLSMLSAQLLGDVTVQINPLIGAGWVGMLVTSLNLFPVGQLDGGHVAYAFSRRIHQTITRLTLLGMGVFIVYQGFHLRQLPAYLVWFAILFWMRDRHPRLVNETRSLGPLRTIVAGLLIVIFALSFIPMPISVVEGGETPAVPLDEQTQQAVPVRTPDRAAG